MGNEKLDRIIPKRACKNCKGYDCEYCSICGGTGIDSQDYSYERIIKEDEVMNGR